LTVSATAVLYFLIVLVFISVLPEGERANTTLVNVGEALGGHFGALAIGIAAIFSIGGNLAANMLSVPRLTYALGKLRMLPAWAAQIHPRFSTPGNSVLLLGSLCLIFALSGTFEFLATASSLTRLLTYGVCVAAIPAIRNSANEEERALAYRLPGGYLIPGIAFTLCLWIATHSPLEAWMVTGALLALGLMLYSFASRENTDLFGR
jgi:APA family basic amino acid/polyamine antiporter